MNVLNQTTGLKGIRNKMQNITMIQLYKTQNIFYLVPYAFEDKQR